MDFRKGLRIREKTIFVFSMPLLVCLLLTNYAKRQWGARIPADMKVISVEKIYDNFKEYRGKRVLIEGRIYRSVFPVDVFVNDGTGNIKVELRGELSEFEKKISFISPSKALTDPREALREQKFVRVMGVVDVDRDYPLGSLILGASPIIIASGIELK